MTAERNRIVTSFRLLTYANEAGAARPGILVGSSVFDIGDEMAIHEASRLPYPDLEAALNDWERAKPLFHRIAAGPGTRARSLEGLKLLAPLPRPAAIYCAAANYYDHAREYGQELVKEKLRPYFFIKSSSAVIGTGEPVRLPLNHSKKFDWEIEIAVVIGKAAANVSEKEAMSHVAGYTIMNDLSARDHNRRQDWPFVSDWFEHKSWETSAPMGPWITMPEDIADVHNLSMKTWISGELMQNSSSSQMVFTIPEQIAYISRQITLKPGEIIATGTCGGVGGPQGRFLSPGDDIRMEVEGVGVLANPVSAR
jgi:2-keto-4-pentenoate hydratase/2-oxohepta-3-ene-1,7-dioic acid hydratase in catechol pathway